MVCGSENEVAPDAMEDDYFAATNRQLDSNQIVSILKITVAQCLIYASHFFSSPITIAARLMVPNEKQFGRKLCYRHRTNSVRKLVGKEALFVDSCRCTRSYILYFSL